jgi:hypothetical protein
MENEALLKKVKTLRNLPQYRDKTEEELLDIAQKSIEKKEQKKELSDGWLPEEQELAEKLYNDYILNYEIESLSDKNSLKQLVFYEVFFERLQKLLSDFSSKKDNAGKTPPKTLMESLNDITTNIMRLKEQLGLFQERKQESDIVKLWGALKKKVAIWRKTNPNKSFSCPHCGGMIFLKLREPELYEASKHPLFKCRVLYNDELLNLVEVGRVSSVEAAKILDTSYAYINFLIEQRKKNKTNVVTAESTTTIPEENAD